MFITEENIAKHGIDPGITIVKVEVTSSRHHIVPKLYFSFDSHCQTC